MNFKINLNGTSIESMVDQQIELHKALDEFRRALRNAWPHGRDYQIVENPDKAWFDDAHRFSKAMARLQNIEDELIEPRMSTLIAEQERLGK